MYTTELPLQCELVKGVAIEVGAGVGWGSVGAVGSSAGCDTTGSGAVTGSAEGTGAGLLDKVLTAWGVFWDVCLLAVCLLSDLLYT